MVKYILHFCIAISFLASCTNNAIYEKNQAIAARSWSYDEIPKFDIHIDDSTSKYNVYINLRHSNEFDFSNIFILLHEKGNSLIDTSYRKEITLAQPDGRWLGKTAGSVYELQHLVKENYIFPDTGVYTFAIEQNMRENPLKDVVDVGIKVVKQ